jgi:hypothetical protein
MLEDPPSSPLEPVIIPDSERRHEGRFRVHRGASGFVRTGQDEVLFPERIVDVSTGGVQLVLSRRLEPGTSGVFQIYNVARDFSSGGEVRVVYANEDVHGMFAHGCTFARRLSQLDLWGLRGT